MHEMCQAPYQIIINGVSYKFLDHIIGVSYKQCMIHEFTSCTLILADDVPLHTNILILANLSSPLHTYISIMSLGHIKWTK
jgi:hypothetical protein